MIQQQFALKVKEVLEDDDTVLGLAVAGSLNKTEDAVMTYFSSLRSN